MYEKTNSEEKRYLRVQLTLDPTARSALSLFHMKIS